MADKSPIEWLRGADGLQGATWNPITGCSVISAGCKHCYAMKLAGGRLQHHPSRAGLTIDTAAGPVWNGQVRLNEAWLDQPLRWTRGRMIFVCAHGDLFHEAVPDEWIAAVFGVMAAAPRHTFLVLTKRPERMLRWFAWRDAQIRARDLSWEPWRICEEEASEMVNDLPAIGCQSAWPLRNVWLGVSAEHQAAADERIPLLLKAPAAVRWISAEPLLGPVDLRFHIYSEPTGRTRTNAGKRQIELARPSDGGLHWVVAGGESGVGARPMHPDWPRSLRDQCAAAGVPFFFKQWGGWLPSNTQDQPLYRGEHRHLGGPWHAYKVGKAAAGRVLDGVTHDGYPGARTC
jgi:protein gp37